MPAKTSRSSRKPSWSYAGFARFAGSLRTERGEPLKIHPFQRRILRAVFAGVIELVVLLPKKNGKTTLLAALALYHLLVVEGAEAVIGASSRDQATVLLNQAIKLVKRSGLEHVFAVKTGYREIRANGGRLRVLAADADTADGIIPTLALVDELHRHASGELYAVFRDGLLDGAQMVTISTAGYDEDSPLGVLRRTAHALPSFTRRGKLNHARSTDGTFELLEWCLEPDDDLDDLEAVLEANPLQTLERLRRRHDSPSMKPAEWARFACGVWTFGETPWLRPEQWDRLRTDLGGVSRDDEVWIHVSWTPDEAFIALASPRAAGAVAVTGIAGEWSLAEVEDRLRELDGFYNVQEVGGDRREVGRSLELVEEDGVSVELSSHSAERISVVSSSLHRLVHAGLLHHDGSVPLREHVLRGITKDSEAGWRFVSTPRSRGLIALAFAAHRATAIPPEEPRVEAL